MPEMSMETYANLPQELRERIDPNITTKQRSRLGGEILEVYDKEFGESILKIDEGPGADEIRSEVKCLQQINGRLPTPILIGSWAQSNRELILISKIGGLPGHEAGEGGTQDVFRVIDLFAQSLSEIHNLPVQEMSFPPIVKLQLDEAENALRRGLIDVDSFKAHVKITPDAALLELTSNYYLLSEDTFTHGDYCLPNIIISADSAKVIDWGQAAVSDKNRDFMSAELTIERNFGQKYVDRFYNSYGPAGAADPEKIRYFWLLDQFEKFRHG